MINNYVPIAVWFLLLVIEYELILRLLTKKVTTLISEDIYIFLVCFKNLNNESDCLRDIHLHNVQSMKRSLSAGKKLHTMAFLICGWTS